ncbi:inorganic pyrophosphatase [Mycoplasma testudineum]|uniref:Inorganic pyrophosphatase n=1 Tax=Mycoplasma testudineum TaxID=244584 RepID=A0A4R6IG66_9MOLU|nr:inorganic diphosphatase [Mycoplasma testudineum]OYD27107.1 inorganic pyrophosphatase [Mycoplasma testudineum]TDO21142.1 inorganic pyrophosphatase [Mycoplasma testudineum]
MEKNLLKVTIEIPKNSNIKYEYDRASGKIQVDRILREGFYYPANYGFLADALDWDGDELDVLVYSPEKFLPGVIVQARIVGAMKMVDDGETDTKLIAVHADDYRLEKIEKLSDLPQDFLSSVERFFDNYKNWKRKGIVKLSGFEDEKWAMKEYKECVELMQKYGSMKKSEFIKLMKEEHPDKYQ